MSATRVAAIFGAGPGNGAAFAVRFLKDGYRVAVLSRNAEAMQKLAVALGPHDKIRGYACDVASDEAVQASLASIQKDLGAVSCVVYNAGSGGFKSIDQWKAADITASVEVNASGLFRVATAVKSQLLLSDQANIVVIGAGAATRGRPGTVGFAAAKAAQRSVAQSLARAWGPEKIHVSFMIIDGMISGEKTKAMGKPEDFFLKSEEIADAMMNVVNQKSSAWTFEYDVRPFGEIW